MIVEVFDSSWSIELPGMVSQGIRMQPLYYGMDVSREHGSDTTPRDSPQYEMY